MSVIIFIARIYNMGVVSSRTNIHIDVVAQNGKTPSHYNMYKLNRTVLKSNTRTYKLQNLQYGQYAVAVLPM